MVDVVALVVSYLTSESVLTVTELADGQARPVVRVEEAGGPNVLSAGVNKLTRQDLQVDVWGTTKAEAYDLASNVRTLLWAAPRYNPDHPEGVFISTRSTGPSWLPDVDFKVGNRPGPRYVFTAAITARN